MKTKLLFALPILIALFSLCNEPKEKSDKIPVTSSNEEALKIYKQGAEAADKFHFSQAIELFKKATEIEPGFFMPHYRLAANYLFFNYEESFKKHANIAISIETELSDGETLMKEALERLVKNKKSDICDLGDQLIDLYPNDSYSYVSQYFFLTHSGDIEKLIECLEKGVKTVDDPATLYNILGYQHMNAENMEAAKIAFDKYIELNPNEPNPYDSKGDYSMAVKDYKDAYDNFMKAYELDTNFKASFSKAEKTKIIIDSLNLISD